MSESMDSLRTISDSSDSSSPSLDFTSGSESDEHHDIRWRRRDSTAHAKFHTERELILRIICDYQTRLNLHTHVGQLPNELLAEIFDHFVSSCYESVRRGSAFRSQSHWIVPAHVCRRWRTVALSTSTFWSFIFVDSSKAFSNLVARSMNAPLSIIARPVDKSMVRYVPRLWPFEKGIDCAILGGIVAESHRIRELCLEGKVSDLQSVCTKLREPLESLELLRLSASSAKREFELIFPTPSFAVIPIDGLTPRLRNLEILKLSVNWTDPVFKCSSLTTLIIRGVLDRPYLLQDAPLAGTVPQLLDVLYRIAPGLNVLSLEEAIPPLPLGTASPPAPSRNITFPSLRSLRLAGNMVDSANLFNHLSPTPTSTVRLEARESIGDTTRIGTAGVVDIARRLSRHIGRAEPLSSMYIELFCQTWHVTCCRTADLSGPPPVLVGLASSYGDHEEMPVTALFRGSGNMFAHVQYLSIVDDTFDLDWAFLFARLPRLQSLECHGHPFGPFFEALSDTVQPDESGGLHVPLPELRILRLVNVLFRRPADNVEQEFVDKLLDWAILRCNYGYALETLELGNCEHATEIDVDLLAEVVPDVGWDGWDLEGDALEEQMSNLMETVPDLEVSFLRALETTLT
ncbi:hypothetical protein LXA43DRAFT_216497 [Ganoderma leucocontextum]|nr:hypothetical protein LXA43DRAFT_216497 [Ganoderma leucocontextum]